MTTTQQGKQSPVGPRRNAATRIDQLEELIATALSEHSAALQDLSTAQHVNTERMGQVLEAVTRLTDQVTVLLQHQQIPMNSQQASAWDRIRTCLTRVTEVLTAISDTFTSVGLKWGIGVADALSATALQVAEATSRIGDKLDERLQGRTTHLAPATESPGVAVDASGASMSQGARAREAVHQRALASAPPAGMSADNADIPQKRPPAADPAVQLPDRLARPAKTVAATEPDTDTEIPGRVAADVSTDPVEHIGNRDEQAPGVRATASSGSSETRAKTSSSGLDPETVPPPEPSKPTRPAESRAVGQSSGSELMAMAWPSPASNSRAETTSHASSRSVERPRQEPPPPARPITPAAPAR